MRTARISPVVDLDTGDVTVGAARAMPTPSGTDHVAVRAAALAPGSGLLVTTYRGDPAAPSAAAFPVWVEVGPSLPVQMAATWKGLDERFRVALAGRSLSGGDPWTCWS